MDLAMTASETQSAKSADTTVLVVDDDPAVRRAVSRLVRTAGFNVRTYASPQEFLRQELPDGPACVVLDMFMDGLTGLEVQDVLRASTRRPPIIFLSGYGTIPTATLAIKRGAEEFLEKPVRAKELIEAIRRAVERDRSLSAQRADQQELARRYDTLTPREREVMSLVVSGLLNKQAAAELNISEKTIKVHRARVMEKMGTKALAELARIAERIGVAPPPALSTRFRPDSSFERSPVLPVTLQRSRKYCSTSHAATN